jgi:hypothetical protein
MDEWSIKISHVIFSCNSTNDEDYIVNIVYRSY